MLDVARPRRAESLPDRSGLQELPVQLAEAVQRPALPPGGVHHPRVNVSEEEVLLVAAAAHEDLAVGVDDVAVPVAHPLVPGDGGVLPEDDVVAPDEPD